MDRAALDVAALRKRCRGWSRITVVDEAGSTNEELLADVDAPDRSVLVAEYQAVGRGRLARSWVSPPRAGLTFSVLLRPAPPIDTWGWLSLLAGVAVMDASRHVAGADVTLKWPNDLLCRRSGKKLAGILAQSSGAAVVIGVGLNVSTTADELGLDTATSLERCGAGPVERTVLLAAVLGRLGARVTEWSDAAGDAEVCGLAEAYRDACSTLGREVAVTTTRGERLVGTAVDLDSGGRLRLAVGGGVRVIGAGDVEHLRPAG